MIRRRIHNPKNNGPDLTDDNFLRPMHDGGTLVRVFLRDQVLYDINVQVNTGDNRGPSTKGLRDIVWALHFPFPMDDSQAYRLVLTDHVANLVKLMDLKAKN